MATAKNKVDKCISWLKLNRNFAENKLMLALRDRKVREARDWLVTMEAWNGALEGVQDILKGRK